MLNIGFVTVQKIANSVYFEYTHEYTRAYTRSIPLVYFAYRTNFALRIFRVSSNISRALMEVSRNYVSGYHFGVSSTYVDILGTPSDLIVVY